MFKVFMTCPVIIQELIYKKFDILIYFLLKHKMNIKEARDILDYWFPKDGSPDYDKWFLKSQVYDDEIKEKFGYLLKQAEAGLGFGWLHTKESFIAYIILLDQFSRHIYRGTSDSFKNDNGALIFAELGFEIYRKELIGYEFMFAFMPYMHTENLKFQRNGTQIFNLQLKMYGVKEKEKYVYRPITNPETIAKMTSFVPTRYDKEYEMLKSMRPHVEGHFKTLFKYGRFPKRNESLGRESTESELKYMALPEVQKRPY